MGSISRTIRYPVDGNFEKFVSLCIAYIDTFKRDGYIDPL